MSSTKETYGSLSLQSLMGKKGKIVSSEEALQDVKPIEWGEEVLRGEKKIIAKRVKDEEPSDV